jgi:hypothetical protein
MLEPSDLHAAVTRLLVGFAHVISATALLCVVALCAQSGGHMLARNAAVLALGATVVCYMLQHRIVLRWLLYRVLVASWALGVLAVVALILGGS